jgi:TrmH RNA methyltransferase
VNKGPRRPKHPHAGKNELHFYGKNACLALWKNRPKDILRAYVRKDLSQEFSGLLEYCSQHRKSYSLVGDGDLERLTDSVHHQGVCILAENRRPLRDDELLRELSGGRTLILYLDGIGNPHNLGAILRTAAHFGVRYIAVPKESFIRLSPAANRTSEGAAEFVSLVQVENVVRFFESLQKKGFSSYSFTADEKNASVYESRLSERAVFVFGNEVEGVSRLVQSIVERTLRIPGTGAVESLNVSVAAALAMAEFSRQGNQKNVRLVRGP